MGGGGRSVAGSVSVSQLLEAVKSSPRSRSAATDDHTFPQPLRERGWSQPERVARKPAGRPSSASEW